MFIAHLPISGLLLTLIRRGETQGTITVTKTLLQGAGAALIAALLASAIPAAAADTYYRWKDERGNTVHSDRPPPSGTEFETISTSSSLVRKVPAAAAASSASSAATNTATPAGGQPAAAAKEELEVVKRNPDTCERARNNLATLDSAARIRIRGDDGEMRFLNEEEKEAQRAKARDLIDAHCE